MRKSVVSGARPGRRQGSKVVRAETRTPSTLPSLRFGNLATVLANPVWGEMKKAPVGALFISPQTGLEPVTLRLTAGCSTIELLRIALNISFFLDRSQAYSTPALALAVDDRISLRETAAIAEVLILRFPFFE